MTHAAPPKMSESLAAAAFLSLSGGLQDAYTYFARGGVFANAQTGNVVLLSQHLFAGQFAAAGRCLLPLASFALGIAAAEQIRRRWHSPRLHWQQLVLAAEIALLLGVGFLPERWNPAANALVSFACAMQVQTFRKVNGYAFASTMCIGDLRSGMEALCAYGQTHAPAERRKALHYFGIIGLFALGAGLGSRLIAWWGLRTIWASCLLLLVCFGVIAAAEKPHP